MDEQGEQKEEAVITAHLRAAHTITITEAKPIRDVFLLSLDP